MKFRCILLKGTLLSVMLMSLVSCFKEEPLNAEADIEQAQLIVDNPDALFYNATDATIDVLSDQTTITFDVRAGADLTALAPTFRLTEGATVSPASGSVHDFSQGPVTYVVTSQDGKTQRTYTIAFRRVSHTVTEVLEFNFEHYELEPAYGNRFYKWHNMLADGTLGNDWSTGNPGYYMSGSTRTWDQYPTMPDEHGFDGACVRLVTRDTGTFGKRMGMPFAAGNLFLGKFDVQVAVKGGKKSAMNATMFGIPFDQKPVKFTGYYKYTPGPTFQDENKNVVPGRVDQGDIYSVLYRNHDKDGNAVMLLGDNVLSSDLIVAVARIPKTETTSEWTPFELEYQYRQELDPQLLKNRGYSLTVVFSSSIEGASFEGAVDSELWIDKVRVYTEKEE